MTLWSRVADLPLEIDGHGFAPLEQSNPSGFSRLTTEVVLRGAGAVGRGEDVSWAARDQELLRAEGSSFPLAGRYTLASFSARLEELELWPEPPAQVAHEDYRRWAFESAALDLALRQSGLGIAEALGREARPVNFVASTMLGRPPSLEPLRRILERVPGMRFKIDAAEDWTDELVGELAELGRVDVVDLKGHYVGTPVDLAADAELYARVVKGLPACFVEDPALDPRTAPLFEDAWQRVTWDAPIHGTPDVTALEHVPHCINVKPSRAGRLEALFALYEHCETNGIAMYGGGQFELGVGRDQIQVLASLFHPDGPNDVAPRPYNRVPLPDELPASPLAIELADAGFGFAR